MLLPKPNVPERWERCVTKLRQRSRSVPRMRLSLMSNRHSNTFRKRRSGFPSWTRAFVQMVARSMSCGRYSVRLEPCLAFMVPRFLPVVKLRRWPSPRWLLRRKSSISTTTRAVPTRSDSSCTTISRHFRWVSAAAWVASTAAKLATGRLRSARLSRSFLRKRIFLMPSGFHRKSWNPTAPPPWPRFVRASWRCLMPGCRSSVRSVEFRLAL
jgi:hypothetical protein